MRGRPSKEFLWRLDTKKDLTFGVPLFSLFVYKMFRVYVNVSFSNKMFLFFTRKCLLSIRTPNIESPFRPKKTYLVETRQSIKQTPKESSPQTKKRKWWERRLFRIFRVSWCVRGDDSFLWRPTYTYIYIYTRAYAHSESPRKRARFLCLSRLSLFSVFCFVQIRADSIETVHFQSRFFTLY